MSLKPVLIFAYGNISRGDDALAPLLIEQLQDAALEFVCGHPVKYLCDYQILVEHILDLQGCERVLLIDAHQSLSQPYTFELVQPKRETSYTTHGISPATLLSTYENTLSEQAPTSYLLAVQGHEFNLGEGLSSSAQKSLDQAFEFSLSILQQDDFHCWDNAI
jgi:hydrogenase maturation protease